MVEAASSPFHELQFVGPPDYFKDLGLEKPYGFTRTPLTYSPPAPPQGLDIVQEEKPEGPGLVRCWMQKEPARKLVNFNNIPVLIMNAEASFQAPSAHCASLILKQAGVDHDFIRLADIGIHGNGHFLMHEKNNLEIAAVIANWLNEKVTPLEKSAAH
jgi:hypothetical protein